MLRRYLLLGALALTTLLIIVYMAWANTNKVSLALAAKQPLEAKVLEVIDAQTLLVSLANRTQLCLVFNGINTPLKNQPGYLRSVLGIIDLVQGSFKNKIMFSTDIALNSKVKISSIHDIGYQVFGNLALIEYGYAWPDTYFTSQTTSAAEQETFTKEFYALALEALNTAKSNKRGHWAGIHLNEPSKTPPQSYLQLLQEQGHSSAVCQP